MAPVQRIDWLEWKGERVAVNWRGISLLPVLRAAKMETLLPTIIFNPGSLYRGSFTLIMRGERGFDRQLYLCLFLFLCKKTRLPLDPIKIGEH